MKAENLPLGRKNLPPRKGFVVLRDDKGYATYIRADKIVAMTPHAGGYHMAYSEIQAPYSLMEIHVEGIQKTFTGLVSDCVFNGEYILVEIWDGFNGLQAYNLQQVVASTVSCAKVTKRKLDLT